MKKFLVNEIELRRNQKTVLKNKKHRIRKIIKGALVGMSVFFAGASIASEKATTLKQQEYNIALIDRINVGDKTNTGYDSFLKTNSTFYSHLRENIVSNSKYLTKGQENVYINFMIPKLNEAHKFCIDCAIDELNEINVKTYTGFPNIVANYSPTDLDLVNPTSVRVIVNDSFSFKSKSDKLNLLGFEHGNMILTANGIQTIYDKIVLKTELLDNPIKMAGLLTHELMHSLYGLGDEYLLESKNDEYYKTIMNTYDDYTFLSLNDIKMIDYLSWKTELTEEQIANVRDFYIDYQNRYEANDNNYLKVQVVKKMLDNDIINEEKVLDKLKEKYNIKLNNDSKISGINKESYLVESVDSMLPLGNGEHIEFENNMFTHLSPEKIERTFYSVKINDKKEFNYTKNESVKNATALENFTLFGDRLYFEFQDNCYSINLNHDLSFNVINEDSSKTAISQAEYNQKLDIQNKLYDSCKDIKTKSYEEMVEKIVYNKIMLDYENNVFKDSFSISSNDYKLDTNFGNDEFTYNFSINKNCHLKLVCKEEQGEKTVKIFNNETNSVVQKLKTVKGVILGEDMAFVKIGKKIIGMMIDSDKIVKQSNGLYSDNISVDYNIVESYDDSII